MVTWIPSIYPLDVSINIPAPWIRHGVLKMWDPWRGEISYWDGSDGIPAILHFDVPSGELT